MTTEADGFRSVNYPGLDTYEVRGPVVGEVPVRSGTICAHHRHPQPRYPAKAQPRRGYAVLGNYKLHGYENDAAGGRVKVGELLRLLAEDGWQLARTRGSHRQYKHPSKPGTVTVAGKPSLDVPPGTLNAILKQAGLRKEK